MNEDELHAARNRLQANVASVGLVHLHCYPHGRTQIMWRHVEKPTKICQTWACYRLRLKNVERLT